MADDSATPVPPVSERARERAETRARRAKRAGRREACFEAFVSGFSPHAIAREMKVSPATVRRLIDQALAERRPAAPEAYARVQVARLSKALCAVDDRIEQGDIRAVPTLVKLVAALDRYHGLDARRQPLAPGVLPPEPRPALPPPPPLALTHAASVANDDAAVG